MSLGTNLSAKSASETTVAVLGLGAMGSRMASNLLQSGYPVILYNRSPEKLTPLVDQGAVSATTPREAAAQANLVISMVTDDEASRSLWLTPETGAAFGLTSNHIAIESSTLTVDWTREWASAIAQQKAKFLDAPVAGSRPQAEAKQLIYLVGGHSETLEKAQPVLHAAGAGSIHHVGDVGQGMLMKLAVNSLFGTQVAALAEILGLLSRDGISPEQAMACLGQLPVVSPAAKGAGGLIAAQKYAPLFPIDLVEKDFRYAQQTTQSLKANAPVTAAIREVYQQAIAQGFGQDNITGIAQLFL